VCNIHFNYLLKGIFYNFIHLSGAICSYLAICGNFSPVGWNLENKYDNVYDHYLESCAQTRKRLFKKIYFLYN